MVASLPTVLVKRLLPRVRPLELRSGHRKPCELLLATIHALLSKNNSASSGPGFRYQYDVDVFLSEEDQ